MPESNSKKKHKNRHWLNGFYGIGPRINNTFRKFYKILGGYGIPTCSLNSQTCESDFGYAMRMDPPFPVSN